MNHEHLKKYLSSVGLKHFPKDEKVFDEGDDSNGIMYFVFSGKLMVTRKSGTGEELILRHIGPGEFFGELALIQPAPRAANVIAIADDTKVGLINRDIFLAMGKESPEFLSVLLHTVIRRLTEVEEKVEERKQDIHELINRDTPKPVDPMLANLPIAAEDSMEKELPIPVDTTLDEPPKATEESKVNPEPPSKPIPVKSKKV